MFGVKKGERVLSSGRIVGLLALVLVLFVGACDPEADALVCPSGPATTPAALVGTWELVASELVAPIVGRELVMSADATFTDTTTRSTVGPSGPNYDTTTVAGPWSSPAPAYVVMDGICHQVSVDGLVLVLDGVAYGAASAKAVAP